MDNDEFGPLTSAVDATNGEISTDVQQILNRLQQEKAQMEADFGQKRAQFMEFYKQKEDDLAEVKGDLTAEMKKTEALEEQLQRLQTEIEDTKTAAAISEASKEEYVMEIQRKCEEEIKSLQHIMREALEQAHQGAAEKFQQDHAKLITGYEKMEKELQDTKHKLSQEREGFLTSVTKTLQKKVGAVAPPGQSQTEQESLEDSMRKAQEDAEILKSVVMPLEEEIYSLREKLDTAYGKIAHLEGRSLEDIKKESTETCPTEGSAELDDRLRELNQSLEVEKASRSDLEMYVAVINTQKNVLQEDNEKLMTQLQQVVKILEQERHEHNNLKHTWQMANDQFLQSQRLMMTDFRHMESVMTTDQQRKISELKKSDAEQEKKNADSSKVQSPDQTDATSAAASGDSQSNAAGSSTSLNSEELPKIDEEPDKSAPTTVSSPSSVTTLIRSGSSQSLQSITKELFDSGMHETRSLPDEGGATPGGLRFSPDRSVIQVPNLTAAQQKAITDPMPTTEASQSLIASIKAKAENFSTVGKRLVSEKEWDMLQNELRSAREKVGRPCEMCRTYEDQLQTSHDSDKKAQGQVRTLERHLQAERQANTNQSCYIEELERNLKDVSQTTHSEITTLLNKLEDSEKFVTEIRQGFIHTHTELQHHLRAMTNDRESMHKELTRLQDENDSLISKHSKHSQQLQEECINLPNNLEEMQLLLLRYREDIIAAKVAKEHVEENLRSEIMFLKDQLLCEQQEKSHLEEAMSQEISQLQRDLADHRTLQSNFEQSNNKNSELEAKVKDTDSQLKSIQGKSQKLTGQLQAQITELQEAKAALEKEITKQRVKVGSLQVDLENSEAVQRDFVKLSQSLQIQLEKIRSAEHEVRWQHEEDVEECSNCRQGFSVTRRKHHCRHCGKIFCTDCTTKIVNSGPNLRPSKVCDVCHTILVRDATPYFSTEVPQTPD